MRRCSAAKGRGVPIPDSAEGRRPHVSPELALRAYLLPALAKHSRCDVQRILISLQLALRLLLQRDQVFARLVL
jgi:hypothetical protein